MKDSGNLILGGGITGLSAGLVSGLPVYESETVPGGICSSYYLTPGGSDRLFDSPEDGEAYRFEIGGGHWIVITSYSIHYTKLYEPPTRMPSMSGRRWV